LKLAVLNTKTGAFKHASCSAILVQSFKMQKNPANGNENLKAIKMENENKFLQEISF